ncbi:hypothetical protein GGR55DRAFT_637640 [Xylaria sp. FL0064]|nr:hypothetical protein GGR55DRAFT_637640 [Xylaria sp. FL0064]
MTPTMRHFAGKLYPTRETPVRRTIRYSVCYLLRAYHDIIQESRTTTDLPHVTHTISDASLAGRKPGKRLQVGSPFESPFQPGAMVLRWTDKCLRILSALALQQWLRRVDRYVDVSNIPYAAQLHQLPKDLNVALFADSTFYLFCFFLSFLVGMVGENLTDHLSPAVPRSRGPIEFTFYCCM